MNFHDDAIIIHTILEFHHVMTTHFPTQLIVDFMSWEKTNVFVYHTTSP